MAARCLLKVREVWAAPFVSGFRTQLPGARPPANSSAWIRRCTYRTSSVMPSAAHGRLEVPSYSGGPSDGVAWRSRRRLFPTQLIGRPETTPGDLARSRVYGSDACRSRCRDLYLCALDGNGSRLKITA